tara:strand:- start:1735 stop:2601 length:867 start_codon:yes stop_codon:yes gene_type:complete
MQLDAMVYDLAKMVGEMHLNAAMQDADVSRALDLAEGFCNVSFALMRSHAIDNNAIDAVHAKIASTLSSLRKQDDVCAIVAPNALQPVARPLLGEVAASKRRFAFFSLFEVAVDTLQNDRGQREHFMSSSADWGTGRYLQPADIMTDVMHGRRFRESELAKESSFDASGRRIVKLGLQGWNDDATVRNPMPNLYRPSAPSPNPARVPFPDVRVCCALVLSRTVGQRHRRQEEVPQVRRSRVSLAQPAEAHPQYVRACRAGGLVPGLVRQAEWLGVAHGVGRRRRWNYL